MSPVGHTSDAERSPRTTISIGRRIALAGIVAAGVVRRRSSHETVKPVDNERLPNE